MSRKPRSNNSDDGRSETRETLRLGIVAMIILLVFVAIVGARLLLTSPLFIPPTATPTPFPTSTPLPPTTTFTPAPATATPCPTVFAIQFAGEDGSGRSIIDQVYMGELFPGEPCKRVVIHEMLYDNFIAGTPPQPCYIGEACRTLPRGATITPSPTR